MKKTEVPVSVQGHSDGVLMWIEIGVHQCGTIVDGLVFRIGDEAGFVVDFLGLERAYKEAKKVREKKLRQTLAKP